MRAIEFVAREKDGVIALPREHRGMFKKNVRVIILVDDDLSQQKSKTLMKKRVQPLSFNAVRVKTKNLKFSREVANER